MNPNTLPTEVMVVLGKSLLDTHRAALEALPATAGLVPTFEQAQARLLTTQLSPAQADAELTRLSTELAGTDATHDRLARGVFLTLEGWIELAADAAERAELEALRDHLFPRGLRIIKASWLETAGSGELLAGRLTAAQLDKLNETRVAGATLKTHVLRWIEAADRLGELLGERSARQHAQNAVPTAVRPSDVHAARGHWTRTLNALLAVLELTEPEGTLLADLRADLAAHAPG